jgi:hypothetical protein
MDESLSSILFIMRCMSVPTLESFKWRLAETIAWREYKKTLRSEELMPEWWTEIAIGQHVFSKMTLIQRTREFDELSNKRAALFKQVNKYPIQPAKNLSGGRLVICDVEMSVWDGASEQASNSFFDVYDAPSWDVWLFCLPETDVRGQHYSSFMAWVPPAYLTFVGKGIDVNPVANIVWAENSDSSFIQTLREAGFVQKSNSL